jgi:hypothetical protein
VKKRVVCLLAVLLPVLCLGATAAAAGAATVYVSNSAPVVPGGRSCAQPAYNTVQAGIAAAAGGTVDVCAGTYTEQVTITGAVKLKAVSGVGTATLQMPATPALSATACDSKAGSEEQIDEVSICTSGTVSMTGIDVEALIPMETCQYGLNAIFVSGGATLKSTDQAVRGASTTVNAFKGCQHGLAIRVGSAGKSETGHASIKGADVSGYEKNGPTVSGPGSTMSISSSTITGAGPSPYIAQNGIEIAFGGQGKVKGTSVSGNECEVASCGATGEQASGVLYFEAAPGDKLSGSTVADNDLGVYYASGKPAVAPAAEVTVSKDVLSDNRYEGVELEEGHAALTSDTIDGSGRVGIDLYQYEGQTSASESTAKGMHISGQSEAAIKVESDKQPGDIPGKFVITNSTESGNGSVLINESNNFQVIF